MKKLILTTIFLLTLSVSTMAQDQPTTMNNITQDEAVKVVAEYLVENGINLDNYEMTTPDLWKNNQGWTISFHQTKTNYLHRDILIDINSSGKITFLYY